MLLPRTEHFLWGRRRAGMLLVVSRGIGLLHGPPEPRRAAAAAPALAALACGNRQLRRASTRTGARTREPVICRACGFPGHVAAKCPREASGRYDRDHSTTRPLHRPVLVAEIMHELAPRRGGVYLDATFGCGGHTRALLATPGTKVVAFDRDPDAIEIAHDFAQSTDGRVEVVEGTFSELAGCLSRRGYGAGAFDGIIMDVGASSMQLDQADRGFSFGREGPLDMRMSCGGMTAGDVVNNTTSDEIARIIDVGTGGQEKFAREIAAAIVCEREREGAGAGAGAGAGGITTTLQLAQTVARAVEENRHPASNTYALSPRSSSGPLPCTLLPPPTHQHHQHMNTETETNRHRHTGRQR